MTANVGAIRWFVTLLRKRGNYSSYISGTFGFKDGNYVSEFWKWILPNRESDYNSAIEMK